MHAADVHAWGAAARSLSTLCQLVHPGHLSVMAQVRSCHLPDAAMLGSGAEWLLLQARCRWRL